MKSAKIPCKNCICLVMCKSEYKGYKNIYVYPLMRLREKCVILQRYTGFESCYDETDDFFRGL